MQRTVCTKVFLDGSVLRGLECPFIGGSSVHGSKRSILSGYKHNAIFLCNPHHKLH